ncbi:beta-lactamase/transpeptidase-like protein [Tothia fuscella]|uniref:Beta-lactamase/transpeptidase-like protein n=1 Tax=Tothia fuscella TaxID=1048955 RepID=A0A9P4NJA9_9PEZI|nr:beta-lactamase/transpeptidase-like protein [Tothia fuscella]
MPTEDPLSHAFGAESFTNFNSRFHEIVNERKLSNILTLVSRHGKIVHLDAHGVLDISSKPTVPVQTDSIFRIASMTKPITGVAMMILWEEGKWDLEDLVAKHIPEFKDLKVRDDEELVPQNTPMTMKQLMSHSAGFGRSSDYSELNLREGDLQDMVDVLAKKPLYYQPGKDWRYGPSVDIQGYIIQKLSEQRLDEFFEERLFAPLGMHDTGFWVDPSKSARIARIHRYDEDRTLIPAGDTNVFPTERPKFLAGGGGLYSKIEDYWRFSQMLLNGGEFEGRRYLKASTVELMHTNVLESGVNVTLYSPHTRGLGFGMDFAVILDPKAAKTSQGIHSFYWGGFYGTWFWIDPVNDLVVIGFMQLIDGTKPDGAPEVRELSARLVYEAMGKPKP